MSDMKLFQNPEFGKVRCYIVDGEPWFVAKDICDALDLSNVGMAIDRLDDDEKNTISLTDGNRGNPNAAIVSEPGLYSLVLVSRKPDAKKFKRWIAHTVLPSIRKHGVYATPEAVSTLSDKELMARAVLAAQETIKQIEAERDAEKALAARLTVERNEAVRTRGMISSSREATIMGRLGNEVKRNAKLTKENTELKDKLGISKRFMTVKNIPWIFKYMQRTPYRGTLKIDVFNRLGSALQNLCKTRGIKLGDKVADDKGNHVNVYPVEAINLMESFIASKDDGNFYYRMLSDYMRPEYRN